jgi:hypothetical protein
MCHLLWGVFVGNSEFANNGGFCGFRVAKAEIEYGFV